MGREGVLFINLKSSVPSSSAENLTYAFISNAVFRKKHRLIFQRAFQRNGVSIFANYDPDGNATFGLLGRTSTQIKHASELLTKFAKFQYTERDLKDGVKALRDSFDSISEQGIPAQLGYYAATATKLATARTIGGVSFDGSANIDLPGVNSAGNKNTSGNAATASVASSTSGNATTCLLYTSPSPRDS